MSAAPPAAPPPEPTPGEGEAYQALLEVSAAIASHDSLEALCAQLARCLAPVAGVEALFLTVRDPTGERPDVRLSGSRDAARPLARPDAPPEAMPSFHVARTGEPLLVDSTHTEPRFPECMRAMRETGIGSIWCLPLETARGRVGAVSFARLSEGAPTEAGRSPQPEGSGRGFLSPVGRLLDHVAKALALAVERHLERERAAALARDLAAERDRLRLLLDISEAVARHLDLRLLFEAVGAFLDRAFRSDYTSLALPDEKSGMLVLHALRFPSGSGAVREGTLVPRASSPAGRALEMRRPYVVRTAAELARFENPVARRVVDEGIRSSCSVPLMGHGRALGTLTVASIREDAFDVEAVRRLEEVARQIAPAVENALAYAEIAALQEKLAVEKRYLEGELGIGAGFEGLVGTSGALERVKRDIETVAATDATVLIQGETGTGKELVARAIHERSGRRGAVFVKINCAAIPGGLLESELFGHERGAFTGAVAQKVGRFELADGGTLFLDEVGDIAPELQPKLLRVLQERELERIGGTRTIKVDVRLLAATNRDLAAMVAEGRFRSDLFYRLNVFPIALPPLRERPGDIAALVRSFVEKFAGRMGKRIERVPAEALAALSRYRWPGNVRELENLVERSVILSRDDGVLRVPLAELDNGGPAARLAQDARGGPGRPPERSDVPAQPPREIVAPGATEGPPVAPAIPTPALPDLAGSLADAERRAIVEALAAARGRVGGPGGAAERLGLARTTLQSKIKKLGIPRPTGA